MKLSAPVAIGKCTNYGAEFLATRDTSRPLFLVISFPHPHAP